MAHEKQGRAQEALTVLERALMLARPGGFIFPFLELGPPLVDLLNRLVRKNVVVDYIGEILAAFRDEKDVLVQGATEEPVTSTPQPFRPSTPTQPLVEPLTHREMDVLELLSRRLQNKEIALKLFISPLTVKSHLKSIYQKLSVKNRREAVEKTRELEMLRI